MWNPVGLSKSSSMKYFSFCINCEHTTMKILLHNSSRSNILYFKKLFKRCKLTTSPVLLTLMCMVVHLWLNLSSCKWVTMLNILNQNIINIFVVNSNRWSRIFVSEIKKCSFIFICGFLQQTSQFLTVAFCVYSFVVDTKSSFPCKFSDHHYC